MEWHNTITGETGHGSTRHDYEEKVLSDWIKKLNALNPHIIYEVKKLDKKE